MLLTANSNVLTPQVGGVAKGQAGRGQRAAIGRRAAEEDVIGRGLV